MKKLLSLVLLAMALLNFGCLRESKEDLTNEELMVMNFKKLIYDIQTAENIKRADLSTVVDGVYVDKSGNLEFYSKEFLITLSEDSLNELIADMFSATETGKRACIVYSNRSLPFTNMATYSGPQDFSDDTKSDAAIDVISLNEPVFDRESSDYIEASGDAVAINVSNKTITGLGNTVNSDVSADLDGAVFTYSSSDTAVATVDEAGLIEGIAVGTATITVSGYKNEKLFNEVTFTVTVQASANNNLSALEMSLGTIAPAFDSATETYTVIYENTVESIKVKASTEYSTATVKINGAAVNSGVYSNDIALAVGDNSIEVKVTAEDGTSIKTYTITAKRKALIGITADDKEMAIGQETASGVVTNPADAALTYSSSNTAIVTVDTAGNLKAVAKGTATITVNASKDMYTTTAASFNVTVKNNDADLTALALSQGSISPAFAVETLTYTAQFENSVESIQLTASLSDSNASIKVNGTALNSGADTGNIALAVGNNSIELKVTAEDGQTVKTYTVTVNRKALVAISADDKNIGIGETVGAGLTVNPADATLTYTVSDSTVISVDESGNITGLAEGSSTVKVTAVKDGYTTTEFTFTVNVVINIDATVTSGAVLSEVFQQYHIDFAVNYSEIAKIEIYASGNKIGEAAIADSQGAADILVAVGTAEISFKALKSDNSLIKELVKSLN